MQRYGKTSRRNILELMGGGATLLRPRPRRGSTFVNSFLSEITSEQRRRADRRPRRAESRTTNGVVDLDADEAPPPTHRRLGTLRSSAPATSGLVWFTGHDHRLTVEELEELYPGLVASVAAHPGRGDADGSIATRGAVVFGPNGHALP